MTAGPRLTKAAQRAATTANLVEVARALFAELGYAETATEEIVHRAGVTRGALYHHFGNKKELFQAVVAAVQQELAQQIISEAEATDDLWEQLLVGCRAFLMASLDPGTQRILLVDAPAVLGWETWRALDAEHSMQTLEWVIQALIEQGTLQVASVPATVHLLSGAMNEAALWIAQTEAPEAAVEAAMATLEQMLRGLRTNG